MWKNTDTVIYYISPEFKYYQTIAIFSFIGTIIKKTNDQSRLDYIYSENLVLNRINMIEEKGTSIILYDSFNSSNLEHVTNAIDKFRTTAGFPIMVFISTKRNRFSKPFTSVMRLIELAYERRGKLINKSLSLVIGNKAGRITMDKDCSDRAFAHNIGINFTIPERFFLGRYDRVMWNWNKNILPKANRADFMNTTVPIILDEINKLPAADKYTIIVTGAPVCGKTTLLEKIKRKWPDYNKGLLADLTGKGLLEITDMELMSKTLIENKSVIIETVCDTTTITKILQISMENKTPILIIEIKAPRPLLNLLNCIKVQNAKKSNIILLPKQKYTNYLKKYKQPLYKDVPCVKYIEFPLVLNNNLDVWYEY
jgi:DNA 3'-phosphatase